MSDDRLHPAPEPEDELLGDAFRSVRDAFDGSHEESSLTLQRALFRTRVKERRQRFVRWTVLPAAAVLVASTAWAGMTGRLAPAVRAMLDAVHDERSHPTAAPPSASGATEARVEVDAGAAQAAVEVAADAAPLVIAEVAPPVKTVEAAPAPRPEAQPSREPARAPVAVAPSKPAVAPAVVARNEPLGTVASAGMGGVSGPAAEPWPAPSANDPYASLFEDAHRLHFVDRDPARALAAWDRYLRAAPTGRFAPEARYNRALALVRLGRKVEAQQELAVFANGMYGEYRRTDAKALLDALARDAGP